VWLRDFTGLTRLWVEVGQPEDKPILKACGKADQVVVYAFSSAADVWWKGIQTKLTRPPNLAVWRLPTEAAPQLAALAERSMQLQATVLEGALTLGNGRETVSLECQCWRPAARS
jgi:uncharacterized protein YaeQ